MLSPSHLSLNREGRWGTTEDFATSFLHFPRTPLPPGTWRTPGLSIPRCCLPTSSSVCLVFFPLSLCLAKWFWPDLMDGRHVHTAFTLRLFTMVRSSCGPIASWILAQTFSLVIWPLYEMRSILPQQLISMTRILLCSCTVSVHYLQAYRKMDVTRERISRILELREIMDLNIVVIVMRFVTRVVLSFRFTTLFCTYLL